ncbi:MAG: hypothetical protein IKP81_08710 [Paludibacteraceae bacterium]|nr:hypothetical protein [Paludibacteraceae bacterium]
MGNNEKNTNFQPGDFFSSPEYMFAPIIGHNPIGRIIDYIKEVKEFYERNERWETVHILQNMQIYFENKLNEIKKGIVK